MRYFPLAVPIPFDVFAKPFPSLTHNLERFHLCDQIIEYDFQNSMLGSEKRGLEDTLKHSNERTTKAYLPNFNVPSCNDFKYKPSSCLLWESAIQRKRCVYIHKSKVEVVPIEMKIIEMMSTAVNTRSSHSPFLTLHMKAGAIPLSRETNLGAIGILHLRHSWYTAPPIAFYCCSDSLLQP